MVVETRPVTPLPVDVRAWMEQQIAAGVPAGTLRVRSAETRALTTEVGWPMVLVRSDVVDGERVVARRLHAIYQFGVLGAVAVAEGELDAHAGALVALLEKGRPDLDDREVIALAEVWEGVV